MLYDIQKFIKMFLPYKDKVEKSTYPEVLKPILFAF